MNLYDLEPGVKDMPKTRRFPLVNGNVVIATKEDQRGFWSLSLTQGYLPKEFQGQYTSIEEVEKAVKRYSTYRDIPLGDAPPRPEIKFKEQYRKQA